MSFSYDLTTDAGKVRLLVADTNSSDYVWEDAEISAFLTMAGDSVFDAAAIALRSAASDFKKVMRLNLFGDVSVDPSQTISRLLDLAKSYEATARMDVEAQVAQLQQKIDLYGRDRTDFTVDTAVDRSEFKDYELDRWKGLSG